jgi:hypothetical protein
MLSLVHTVDMLCLNMLLQNIFWEKPLFVAYFPTDSTSDVLFPVPQNGAFQISHFLTNTEE